jgi:response regulator RpfG family c-di-GMP phosphodiesterase
MPEMDGREVLSWISHSSTDIKNLIVFVISAASLDSTEDEVLVLGANYFLSKPINREKFNQYIEDIKNQLIT